jgi:lysozyme
MTPQLYTQLNEGCRLQSYLDSRGIWTIGYGCCGTGIGPGLIWTQDQADQEFARRFTGAMTDAALDLGAMAWERLDLVRRAVLSDMAYELGAHGLAEFEQMLAEVRADVVPHILSTNWAGAGNALMASRYAVQVRARAMRNRDMLLTGQWPVAPW